MANQPPTLKILDPDVNDDGSVNLFNDILAVANAFGTSCGQPGFNPAYDLDGDCTVNLFEDLFLVAGAFGTACWPTPAPTARCPIGSVLSIPSGQPLEFYVQGSDPSGQPLTFSVQGLSAGASFINPDAAFNLNRRRKVSWTPTTDDTGCYYVQFVLSNGTSTTTQSLPIAVNRSDCGDATPPSTPQVADDGAVTPSTTQLHATWTASNDPESGIADYQFQIRQDSPDGPVICDWSSVLVQTEMTASGLSLTEDKTYYIGVRAKNGVGLFSQPGFSDGIRIDRPNRDEPYVPDKLPPGREGGDPGGGYPPPPWDDPDGDDTDTADDRVFLHNGEFHLAVVDLQIPGRGFPFQFIRTYRSRLQGNYHGPLGWNWDFNYNAHLRLPSNNEPDCPSGGILHYNGYGRRDCYEKDPTDPSGNTFIATGYFTKLRKNTDGTFTLRNRDGMKWEFEGFTRVLPGVRVVPGALISIRDRNSNAMQFRYDEKGQLIGIIDTLGRCIGTVETSGQCRTFTYDSRGHITTLTDFIGRTVRYAYDVSDNLELVTSPIVTGPPGNDFPNGKTTKYGYSVTRVDDGGGHLHPLSHNLERVFRPNEVASGLNQAVLTVRYGDTPDVGDSLIFDRVLRLDLGGTNQASLDRGLGAAGGLLRYFYKGLPCTASTPLTDRCSETIVIDRNGHVTVYWFNRRENVILKREFTGRVDPLLQTTPPYVVGDQPLPDQLRPSPTVDPVFFATHYEYNNEDSLLTRVLHPEENEVLYTYDRGNADRFQQGNLLELMRIPGPRGGDQSALVTHYAYEPIYNQVLAVCDPRGSDPSHVPLVEPFFTGCARYTTLSTFDYQEGNNAVALAAELGVTEAQVNTLLAAAGMSLNQGDLNGDGPTTQIHGNVIRTQAPTVQLLPGSQQATIEGDSTQEIITDYVYNDFGQLIEVVDPEGNVTKYAYYPQNDPDGDGQDFTGGLNATPGGYLKEIIQDTVFRPDAVVFFHPRRRETAALARIRKQSFYDRVGNVIGLLDGRGVKTTFKVNELNQVVQEKRAADSSASPEPELIAFSYVTDYFYDHNDNVVQKDIQNKDGNTDDNPEITSTYTYDILDNLIERTEEVAGGDSLARILTYGFRYDANENLIKTIEPVGNFHTTKYDERDLVFRKTTGANDPLVASTITYNYDENGNLKDVIDAQDNNGDNEGDKTTSEYDGFDRLFKTIDAVGNEAIQTYDPASNVLQIIHRGRDEGPSPPTNSTGLNIDLARISYQYDELNRRLQAEADWFVAKRPLFPRNPTRPTNLGDGKATTEYEHDRNSRLTREVNDNDHDMRYDYDGANRKIRSIDTLQNVMLYEYDANNNLLKLTEGERRGDDPNNDTLAETFVTINRYDALNRLRLTRDNIGQTTRYAYDSRDNVTIECDAVGPLLVTEPEPGLGVVNACGNTTRYFYDGINRLIQTTYDLRDEGRGNGTPADLDGGSWDRVSDPVTGVVDEITVRFEWDDNSRLLSQADGKGNTTTYAYDSLNRRILETFADRTTNQFTYDRDHNVTQQVDENGSILRSSYDAINRLVERTIQRAGNVGGTTLQTFEYDGLSRLTKVTDNNDLATAADDSTVTRFYDSLSRLIEEHQNGKVISTSYDGVGNEILLTYPNGRKLGMSYDELERLRSITDNRVDELALPLIADYHYIGPARLLKRGYFNGAELTYLLAGNDVGYDGIRRIKAHRHQTFLGSTIAEFTYGYDRANNRRFERRLHEPVGSMNHQGEAYTYDSLYRLTDFTMGTMDSAGTILSPETQTTYQLDGVGNRVTETIGNVGIPYTTNEMNEYTLIGLQPQTYDDNGNLIDDGTNKYTYDAFNRLIKVTRISDNRDIATYLYDGLNRRIKKDVTDPTLFGITRYFYDGEQCIEERPLTEDVTNQYVWGIDLDELLTLENNLGTFYLHDNSIGSMVAATDGTQAVRERYTYDAFGKVTFLDANNVPQAIAQSAIRNPHLFTGRYFDPETGLYYYRLRYYNPATGRFLQRDPGGMWQDANNLGNAYTYAGNNPVNLVDPTGEFAFIPLLIVAVKAAWVAGKTAALVGAITGATVSGGIAVVQRRSLGEVVGETLTGGLIGGATGFIGGGIAHAAGKLGATVFTSWLVGSSVGGGVVGGTTSALYGGSFLEGAKWGFATGGAGTIAGTAAGHVLHALGKGVQWIVRRYRALPEQNRKGIVNDLLDLLADVRKIDTPGPGPTPQQMVSASRPSMKPVATLVVKKPPTPPSRTLRELRIAAQEELEKTIRRTQPYRPPTEYDPWKMPWKTRLRYK